MGVLASALINKDTVTEWLEQGLESDPADMVGFITDLYETFVGPQSDACSIKPVCVSADPTQPPQIFHLAPGVQYLLQVWTRDNREKEDPPVNLIASSYQALANKFRKYAFKNRDVEDYFDDEEFEECIDEQCELIAAGNIGGCGELHIAYLLDCYELSADQDSEKLISTESTDEEDSCSLNKMAKTNKKNTETIAVTEVAALLCDLGIGLATHFDLDTDEVIEYLDGVCEDAIGANPDSATLFQKVKELQDSDEEDGEDDVQSITQSEFDAWFASGGLNVSELKANAELHGMIVTAKTKKQEIKDYMAELVVPDEEVDDEEYDDEEVDDEEYDDEEVDDEASEDDEEVDNKSAPEDDEQDVNGLTTAQVEIWFMPPSKGGLKIGELRTQAKELGLEITNKTKKDEIKEVMLELCSDGEPENEGHYFEVYLEAPGAKKNKFWKCVVENGCEMTTTYGNVGNKGTSSTKSFDTSDIAMAAAKKLVQQKIVKGYSEPTEEEQESDTEVAEEETLTLDQIKEMNKKPFADEQDESDADEQDESDADEQDESDADEQNECHFVYTKGPQTGNKCTTKPKADAMFCGKHKDCKAAKKESQPDSEPESPKKKVKKGSPKTKSASTGQCLYVGIRGPANGKQCEIKPKDGEEFCAKHANTQQALNYKANESPIAKKAGKKLSKESAQQKGPKIVRNKDAQVWMVEGEILVVKSPKNPTVYAYLTKQGTVNKTLSKAVKTLAEELGLAFC
jgi:predicted DNA-binding WGR domain protein